MTVNVFGGLTTLPSVAVIWDVPTPTPLAKPVFKPIVATETVCEPQVTLAVMFCTPPPLYVPVAVNCCVTPLAIEGISGVTAMDTSTAAVTVSVSAGLATPPSDA